VSEIASYSNYRPNLRSGDLVAWGTVPDNLSLFSKIVVWIVTKALRSPYYHVGIVWRTNNRVLIVEASPPRCRIDVLSRRGDFVHIPMPTVWKKSSENYLLQYVGKPYSIWEAMLVPFKIGGVKNRAWYCSELVSDFYNGQGYYMEGISPEDVLVSAIKEYETELVPVVMEDEDSPDFEKRSKKIAGLVQRTLRKANVT